MVSEKKVLATLIASREAYDKVNEILATDDFSAESTLILSHIRDYYTADPASVSVDIDILLGRLDRALGNPKHYEQFRKVLTNLPTPSVPNVTKELLELRRYSVGLKLSQALASGKRDPVSKLLEEYNLLWGLSDLNGNEAKELHEFDLAKLVERHFDRKNLIQFLPNTLNERFDGGAKPGHQVLIFAPTEMGKTLIALNCVAGFLAQGHKTSYFGNEDPPADLMMRLASRLSGMTKHEIEKDPDRATKLAEKAGVELFTMVDCSPGTFYDVRKHIDKQKPKIIILDQLRNFDVKADGRTQQLEKAATEARNVAKSMGVLVVSITQAADSASGRRILTRGDVDSSNIGIPGQMDAMVGLGATEEEENLGIRTISLPKNKIGADHTHFSVEVEPAYSRIKEAA